MYHKKYMYVWPLRNTIRIFIQQNWNLRKKNNTNSCAFFLDIYIYIENGEFYARLFDKQDNFGFDIVKMPFYCSDISSKMFYGSIGAEFLRISRTTSKIEDLSRNCKQLLSRMLKQNEENQIFLNKNDPTAPRSSFY